MQKRENVVTFGGNPAVLVGAEVKVGDLAPDFTGVKGDMSDFHLSELKGKKVLISVVPSIDTGVCEAQTRRFNQEASSLADTLILTISVDLPFAQKRFCAGEGIENLIMVSDHRNLDFGHKYGFELEGLRLLSRGIVVIDKQGRVQYVEYVPEVTDHPDYDKAIAAIKNL